METIVENLETKTLPSGYADLMGELKMRENDYPLISRDHIEDFLYKHLKKCRPDRLEGSPSFGFNQKHGAGVRHWAKSRLVRVKKQRQRFLFWTRTKTTEESGWTRMIQWVETPINRYEGNPPERVLRSAIAARSKGYADIRVVTTNAPVVEDPLLIAVKNGRRYLLDWWDEDFSVDEIHALVNEK